MLSTQMIEKLNKQITLEMYSSNLYLQMGSWCESKGLEGSARFLYAHAKEELDHMRKLFSYVNGTGVMAVIGAIDKPKEDFKSIKDIFEMTMNHEKKITASINTLVEFALEEKDFSTFNFLQWYVSEQHEEEKLFNNILDKIEIIGIEGRGLFMIDKEIGTMTGSAH